MTSPFTPGQQAFINQLTDRIDNLTADATLTRTVLAGIAWHLHQQGVVPFDEWLGVLLEEMKKLGGPVDKASRGRGDA